MNQQRISRLKKKYGFGNLAPKMRDKVSVYCRETGKLLRDHYSCDLNSVCKKETNDYFITKQSVKIVSDCGYVEYIGGHDNVSHIN